MKTRAHEQLLQRVFFYCAVKGQNLTQNSSPMLHQLNVALDFLYHQ